MTDEECFVPNEWLQERVSVEKVESENMHEGRPFGYQNEEWMRLKAQMIDGDEVWHFSSSAESWQHLAGRGGIALVRGGKAIGGIVTVLN